ncbi:unnamed protein product [Ranitomeya imitator]|uniref:Receptor ligand binding region domain-containing protein n=1 Tax=Ranitomeya imitator TaxID=111125 RepID=A0ABN9LXI8_9NEOB|nr:unnamed protein product [Ranitomeya imitator]
MNGTSASSVHGLPLVAVSGAAGSEVPSTACYHDFALLAGSSGMQSGTSAPANPRKYKHLAAFFFAIEEINNRSDILPNMTLGYHIYDSCGNVNKVIKDVLQILSGHTAIAPNYSCMEKDAVIGFIGDLQSETTRAMAQLLGLHGYSQGFSFRV